MVTRLMLRLYQLMFQCIRHLKLCDICALPFDWDRTFLCGACDRFCGECYQALSWQLNY